MDLDEWCDTIMHCLSLVALPCAWWPLVLPVRRGDGPVRLLASRALRRAVARLPAAVAVSATFAEQRGGPLLRGGPLRRPGCGAAGLVWLGPGLLSCERLAAAAGRRGAHARGLGAHADVPKQWPMVRLGCCRTFRRQHCLYSHGHVQQREDCRLLRGSRCADADAAVRRCVAPFGGDVRRQRPRGRLL